MLQLLSLILFGQQDTLIIKPPFRYVEKGDTFTVFTIKSERILVYKLAQYSECENNFLLAKRVIAKGDTTLFKANNEILILKEEKTNLIAQVENKNKIEDTYMKEIYDKDKKLKTSRIANVFWKCTSGLLTGLTLYFMIN